jgi:hypothetical protein
MVGVGGSWGVATRLGGSEMGIWVGSLKVEDLGWRARWHDFL